ncbi:MAG TPA: acyl carrier protein [Roseiarcus sp.]|nr:acyl carrier protein [Roseiarcus sp.]
MSVRLTIVSEVEKIAKEQKKTLAPLADNLPLLESGLDSLCFAILVARLEDTVGVDPFANSEDGRFPVTFGEFVKFYENAAA